MVPRRFLSGWLLWPLLVLSLLLLNASLTFENVWPTPKIRAPRELTLSVELAVCVLLLAVAHRWAGRLVQRALPALWVLLVAGHYLNVTAPGIFGREFNLYWDSQHLGNVAAMLAWSTPWWLIAAVAGAAVLLIGSLYLLARASLTHVAAAAERRGGRAALAACATLAIAIFWLQQLSAAVPLNVAFADPVTPAYVRQARYALALAGPAVVTPLGASPAFDADLGTLAGADVLLIFVESYGAVTFETPEIAGPLAASRADLDAAIHETGRHVMSAYVDSPTFGASSWLAHLSLISGVDVRDQYAYTSLMASRRETILSNFTRAGYRTVALMPGMRQAWPEGAFYGFDTIYGRAQLDYQGPEFGWWSIPDQYALAKLDALERSRAGRAPLFVVFPTSTTHAPFGPVAPYQPDWPRVLTTTAYEPAEVERSMAFAPDLTNLRPSYTHAMAYEYRSFAGYLRAQQDDPVVILIGDHQPPAAVSGPGASWSVPVHVIAKRTGVLDRLAAHGFQPGLTPQRPAIGPMHALVPVFLDAFSNSED
ncbi:MAG: hypothetical protein A3F70_04540 [Acidobacteria bacterium RIFCSPLOWO2_12_FULL_67_14]|nr:MAG: hypothetical protein A3F70_04540 [Acidobacteria bacterium RIFCSPLOWO2_12_FULL_67_14]